MAITACRLGASPLSLDWTHLGGTAPASPQPLETAWRGFLARVEKGEAGFFRAPSDASVSAAPETQTLADLLRARSEIRDVLWLGIGGSSLGPKALLSILAHAGDRRFKFHFQENPDPLDWRLTLSSLDPSSTLIVVVAKSGVTYETLAQLMAGLGWLAGGKASDAKAIASKHVVALTDPAKGELRAWATEWQVPTLPIHPSMGGRFSAFSPVGLFALALQGMNIAEFLKGALQVRDYCEKTPFEKNPLLTLGVRLQSLGTGARARSVHVMMPYATRLRALSDWWVQLWAESLGKARKGFTPLAACGPMDQHSILQLLREGPEDKVIWFMSVESLTRDDVAIPGLRDSKLVGLSTFRALEGHGLGELMAIEERATTQVLTRAGTPNFTWRLETLDERAIGAMMFALGVLTAVTGEHLGVNPFDQPGVEEGKILIREALQSEASRQFSGDGLVSREEEENPALRLRRGQNTD